jgi:hypothetical protein
MQTEEEGRSVAQGQTGPVPPPEEQPKPGRLSQSDPPPETLSGRTPWMLVIGAVVLVTAMVLLHLLGVVGPGGQ